MGKEIPRSFAKHLSGEQIQLTTFTNVAAAVAAGVTAAKFPASHHPSVRGRHWQRAVPRHFGRHELETDCDRQQRDLTARELKERKDEPTLSHYPPRPASAAAAR